MSKHDLRLALPAALVWGATAWWITLPSRAVLTCALVALATAALTHRRAVMVAAAAACLTVVAVSTAWRIAAVESSPVTAAAVERGVADLSVQVRRDARESRAHPGSGFAVEVEITRLRIPDGPTLEVGDRAIAFVGSGSGVSAREVVVGSRWHLRARLAPAETTDRAATLTVLRLAPAGSTPWWWAGSERVRAGVREAADHGPRDARALVPALVDGDDARIDETLAENFRRSGLTHLLAVSGTNLTIVLASVLVLGRAAGVRRRGAWVLGAVSIVAFVLLARPDPSVVRAAAMGAVGLAALGHGGRGGVRALSWAVVALLFLDPWLARSAGFCLSVCATAGILLLTEPLACRLGRWMPRWCALAVAAPLAAQLACTPALVAISGEISLVAVFANLVVAPVVAPTTVLGLAGGLLALVPLSGGALGALVGGGATWSASWIVLVGRVAGGAEAATLGWGLPWWWTVPLLPLVLIALLAVTRRPVLAAGLVLGLLVGVTRPPQPGWPPPDWVMVACDVGQGDATVVSTGPGEAVVIDAGLEPRAVDRCLRRLGVRRVRALVLTHGDDDHVGGVRGVVNGRAVDLVVSGAGGGAPLPGVPTRTVVAGDRISVGPVAASVLWPATTAAASAGERNDQSIVLRVTTRGLTLLLTGDIEPTAQRRLLGSGADVSAVVLKMPHHGSAHQWPAFLAATGAQVVTISAGRDNLHGHPAPAALEMLQQQGAAWWRTDLHGDIAVSLTDGRARVTTRVSPVS